MEGERELASASQYVRVWVRLIVCEWRFLSIRVIDER